jgi:hypothetical protein
MTEVKEGEELELSDVVHGKNTRLSHFRKKSGIFLSN